MSKQEQVLGVNNGICMHMHFKACVYVCVLCVYKRKGGGESVKKVEGGGRGGERERERENERERESE